jgi:hypothetical protein
MNIFVSYTRINDEVTLHSLIEFSKLVRLFGKVFIDILDNNSTDKQKRVLTELENSELLILIKSENTFNSNWVKLELNTAKTLNIPVVEISINHIDKLTEKELHEVINSAHNKRKSPATNIGFCASVA